MGKIGIPVSPRTVTVEIPQFLGADLTDSPGYMSSGRSPACPNMIRESRGKVRKWIGYSTKKQYPGRINGFHMYSGARGDIYLVHRGTSLYLGERVLRDDMNDERSVSRQLAGKLVIADGKTLRLFYEKEGEYICAAARDEAYVPTVTISRSPRGGGQTYEAVNLIGTKRMDSFLGTARDKVYLLSANQIDRVEKVEKLDRQGNTAEVTGYTADLVRGKVTFTAAPGESPVTGQDNVFITYSKTVEDYAQRINGCDIMTLYGVGGAMDRVFLAGEKAHPNRDYYCRLDDPSYWGDLSYSVIGSDISRIMGYSLIDDELATHIDRSENDTNIVMRQGQMMGDTRIFSLSGNYQGEGAVSKYAFATLETEPLFLTRSGVMAVTVGDAYGERLTRMRSYYLNGLLLKQDLSGAVCAVYDRFYMLAAGDYLFALDGTQSSLEKNTPYSGRQYEGFYRENVGARCLGTLAGRLVFGTEDGKVCRFHTDYSLPENFCDDGEPIKASWQTPEISGDNFYYKKRFRLIAAMIGSAIATGVRILAAYDGVRELVADYDNSARFLSFRNVRFSKFSFRTDKTGRIVREKVSIKPDDRKARFIFENDVTEEPFALYDVTIEFTESR